MADNEITARFGGDTSGFDRALRSMNQGLNQMGESGSLGFGKVAKAGREFKSLIHEASGEMAGLGAVMKFAFSPMAGILAGATAGFAAVKNYISDINKNSDRLEKGTADPVFKMADALEEAKKRLAEFDEQYQHWARTHNQVSPAEKLTQNLKDQLSLLEKQVAVAEKLSQKDKEQLELQKLRTVHGLQGRALHTLAGQIGIDDAAVQAAKAASQTVLGRTDIESAQSAIAADQQQLAKVNEDIEAARKQSPPGFWGKAGWRYLLGGYFGQQHIDATNPDNKLTDLLTQRLTIEKRMRRNRGTVDREQAARRAAANNLSEAQSRLGITQSSFNSMSESIEQTRQALSLIPGGFAAATPESSMQRTADWLAASNSRLMDWNKAHGLGSDLVSFSSLTHKNDEAGNSIATLNDMFKRIITDAGMKVDLTVSDQ